MPIMPMIQHDNFSGILFFFGSNGVIIAAIMAMKILMNGMLNANESIMAEFHLLLLR